MSTVSATPLPDSLPVSEEAAFAYTLAVIEQAYRMRKPDAHENATRILGKLILTSAGLRKREKAGMLTPALINRMVQVEARATQLADLIAQASGKRTATLQDTQGGTPESTVRPTRLDPIQSLYDCGAIHYRDQVAADSIAEVYEAVTAPLMARARAEMPIVLPPKNTGRKPNSGISNRMDDIHAECYLPWTREYLRRGGNLTLVMDVVVDRYALDRARRWHHMGYEKALRHLRNGLGLYGDYFAGYMDRRDWDRG